MSVSLASLKAHLNITDDADDALLGDKLAAASEWVSQYTGGDSASADTPAPILEAIRMLASHLYEHREATIIGVSAQSMPFGVLDLLAPYRCWSF